MLKEIEHEVLVIALGCVGFGVGHNSFRYQQNPAAANVKIRRVVVLPRARAWIPPESAGRVRRQRDAPQLTLMLRVRNQMTPDDIRGHVRGLVLVDTSNKDSTILKILQYPGLYGHALS